MQNDQAEPVWLDPRTADAPAGQRRSGFSTHGRVFWLSCQTLRGRTSLRGSRDEICLLTDEPGLCACGTLVTRQGQNNRRLVCLSQFSPLNCSFAYWNERLWNSDTPPLVPLGVCVQPTHSLPVIASSSSRLGTELFQQWSLKPITHLLREDSPRHEGEIPLCLGVTASCLCWNVARVFCSVDPLAFLHLTGREQADAAAGKATVEKLLVRLYVWTGAPVRIVVH